MANISRDTFNYDKKYTKVIFQYRRHLLDSELNELQDILSHQIEDNLNQLFESNGITYGCNVVENTSDTANKVKVESGFVIFNYWVLSIPETIIDFFTTPSSNRTDTLYLDLYLDEIDGTEDPDIVDPQEGAETTRRIKLVYEFKIAEDSSGLPTPPSGHFYIEFARITRPAGQADILSSNIDTSFKTKATLRISFNDLKDKPTVAGATYVQDTDPSTPGGGSHDIKEGDRWYDTSLGAGQITLYIAGSDWNAGDPPDWVRWERDTHAIEHEIGGGDEINAANLAGQGHGNGFDADTVDSKHASDFADASAFNTLQTQYNNHDHSPGNPTQISHTNLLNIGPNDHHEAFTPSDHDSRDHSAVAPTIALSELGSKKHSELTNIGPNDHHTAFTPSDHDSRDHSPVASTIALSELGSKKHSELTNIGPNDHHNRYHPIQSSSDHNVTGTLSTGDLLQYNGTAWAFVAPKELDISTFDVVIDRSKYASDSAAGNALKSALENSSYSSVFVKAGNYLISSTITQVNTQIVFCEPGTRLYATSSIGTILDVGLNAVIFNLKIDAGGYTSNCFRFNFSSGSKCKLINCQALNSYLAEGFVSVGTYAPFILINCTADNCQNGFYQVYRLVNCIAGSCSNDGFNNCAFLSNCWASNNFIGFYLCTEISSSQADNNTSAGFYNCNRISSCISANNNYGFNNCGSISACDANGNLIGFLDSHQISGSAASSNSSHGFRLCSKISGCLSASNGGYGFDNCEYISATSQGGNTLGGYNSCNYVDDAVNQYSVA